MSIEEAQKKAEFARLHMEMVYLLNCQVLLIADVRGRGPELYGLRPPRDWSLSEQDYEAQWQKDNDLAQKVTLVLGGPPVALEK